MNEGRLSANLPPWPSNTPKMAASGALPKLIDAIWASSILRRHPCEERAHGHFQASDRIQPESRACRMVMSLDNLIQ